MLKGLISVKTEGKQHQKSLTFYWTLGQETKTSRVSSLSPASKPVEVLCFSLTWKQQLSLVSISICHVHCVLSYFWKFQSFNRSFFSFSVTLLCDPVDANKDVGLLFTVNFSEKSITRNARIAGKWGREEKTIPYFPFTAGDTFKVIFQVLWKGKEKLKATYRTTNSQGN